MAVKINHTHICDVCEIESNNSDFKTDYKGGSGKLQFQGQLSQRNGVDGSWGGTSLNIKIDEMCHSCLKKISDSIYKTMKELKGE
jgi:hypothetical protein